jgi:cytochrome c553
MKRIAKLDAMLISVCAAGMVVWSLGTSAADFDEGAQANLEHMTGAQLARIVKGGRLYNNWMHETDQEAPKGDHPLYPASAKKHGDTTWRCKECHGWDGKGTDGAYSHGSHYTGIKGTLSMMGKSIDQAVSAVKGNKHQLSKYLSDDDLMTLGWYLTRAQLTNEDRYIDMESKQVNGNPYKGGRIFQTICARCHGADGKKMNFHTAEDPEYLGTVAQDNPWEALHNIRFGHPGQQMPALIAFPLQTQLDILAYAQTLPEK